MLVTALAAKVLRWVEFRVMRGGEKTTSRIMAMDCQRAGFGLLWDPQGTGYSPGEKRGPGELVDFQGSPLQAQEQCMPTKGKSSTFCGRPAWMKNKLLIKLKC